LPNIKIYAILVKYWINTAYITNKDKFNIT